MRVKVLALMVLGSLVSLTAAGASEMAQPPQATAAAEMTVANSPNPELIGRLTQELGITPKQATGATGAMLGLAKSKLKSDEFKQIADAIPGSDALLAAAPATGALQGKLGGLASLAGGFKSLGLTPDIGVKMVPLLTKFMEGKGSAGAAKLLAGVLK